MMSGIEGALASSGRGVNLHDPRAHRARDAILSAAFALADQAPAALTVSSVVQRAGISKSTFYQHFADIDDLCAFVLDDTLDAINADDLAARSHHENAFETTVRGHRRVIEHLSSHPRFFAHILGAPERARVRDRFINRVAARLESSMRIAAPTRDDDTIRAAALYVAAGFVTVTSAWLPRCEHGSAERLAVELASLAPEWFRAR